MAELKSKHHYEIDKRKEEIERLQRDKDDELNKVHERFGIIFLLGVLKDTFFYFCLFA
jgi:hypothetical protein